MQEFSALANRMADKAGEIIQKYFRQPYDIKTKDDNSPVTIADRAVETALREMIEQERPQDGIIGEEFGTKPSQSGLTWVLDPIDGTKSFIMGRATFGTLIALCEDDVPKLGVIDQAITKERWIGVAGTQTTLNGQPVKTRPCKNFDSAVVASTTPMMFKPVGDYGRAYHIFERDSKMAWGGDCYMYGLLASGYMDMAVEQSLSVYDFAALVPVVSGAGGHISDWRGDALTLSSGGDVIALGDPALWPEIKAMIDRSPF